VDLSQEIGWARARLITPERYEEAAATARRRPPRGGAFTAEAYADYEAAKRKRRLLDFDDLLAFCHSTMQGDERFAEAQRWRYRHLFVDEFQDVNPLQFALLRSWLGPESSLVVVGDPDQAIYGWNGADPDLIREVDSHLPGVAVLHLRTNFRSTPEILSVAGRILDRDPQPAVRPGGPAPTVRMLEGSDEAVEIARAVRGAHPPGAAWANQAVLARTNAQLAPIRVALENASIPVRMRGETALLRRPEIIDVIDRWPGRSSLGSCLADESVELRDDVDPERIAMVELFLVLANDHLALEPDASVDDFLTALRADDRTEFGADAVELATFHAAKGLEWPIVHLVGVEKGYVPIAHASSTAARDEERRLLHVATTRAQRELHVTWCRSRQRGDRMIDREPSPWLEAFEADPTEPPVAPPVEGLRGSLRDREPTAATSPLARHALEEWRIAAARAARVSPGAVLSDQAIDALLDLRPRTTDQLADISAIGPGRARRWGDQLLELLVEPS
jgi:DNA helicase-2/ATP-dependent DNA helicase PcrA